MPSPVLWYVNVFVRDLACAVAFYRDVLGLKLRFADEQHGYASFDTGAVGIGLARIDPHDAAQAPLVGRHTGVGLGVRDLVSAHAELEAKGVRFTMPP